LDFAGYGNNKQIDGRERSGERQIVPPQRREQPQLFARRAGERWALGVMSASQQGHAIGLNYDGCAKWLLNRIKIYYLIAIVKNKLGRVRLSQWRVRSHGCCHVEFYAIIGT